MITKLLFLLGSAAAQSAGLSPLVDDGHTHAWLEVYKNELAVAEMDTAINETVEIEGRTYPTTLMRMAELPLTEESLRIDFTMAVDCAGSRVAALESWSTEMPENVTEEYRGEAIAFERTGFMPAEARTALFRKICGPDWTDTSNP